MAGARRPGDRNAATGLAWRPDTPLPMGGACVSGAAASSGQWVVHLGSGVHRGGRGRTRDPTQQPVTWAAPTVTSRSGRWMLRPSGSEAGGPQETAGESHVTIADAGVLQSFPVDYPWRGGRNSRYRQAGDAMPPLLAAHVLAVATGLPARAGRRHGPQTAAPLQSRT